jgi:hypothetical protein
MKTLLAGFLVVVLAGAILWQRGALADLRAGRDQLAPTLEELARLKQEASDLETLRGQLPEVDRLKEATRDLPALRNRVRQLRNTATELEKVVASCEQLQAQLQAPVPRSISEMPGFVARESWRRAGFATPQATLETLFWVMREGSFEDLKTCMPPAAQQRMSRDMESRGPGQENEPMQSLRKLVAGVKGYRVVEINEQEPDRVVASIQVAAGGDVMKITVRRYGQEWKAENF